MNLVEIYRVLIRHFTKKNSFISILSYLIAAGLIWYMYDIKALLTLILILVSIAAFSGFLLTFYSLLKGHLKIMDKEVIYSLLFVVVMLPLALYTLDKQMLGYILTIGTIITGIGIYRS